MPQIYVSYSRRDSQEVADLINELEQSGLDVWWDKELQPEEYNNFDAISEYELRRTDCLAVVLSPEAKISKGVETEIIQAFNFNKPIIPFLLRGDEYTSIPTRLATLLPIDARSDLRGGVRQLISTYQRIAGLLKESPIEKSDAMQEIIQTFHRDARMLLVLDDFYVHLFSLLMIHQPDPDYIGIQDESLLMESMQQTIQKMPALHHPIMQAEQRQLHQLILQKRYEEARERIFHFSQMIEDFMIDGLEPPTEIAHLVRQKQDYG